MLKRYDRMTGAVTLFGTVVAGILAGAVLALSLLTGNSVRAIVDLDQDTGRTTYALETAFEGEDVGGATYLVATAIAEGSPTARRLSIRAKLGLNVTESQSATVRYEFANMVFHDAAQPALTVEAGGSDPEYTGATISSGGGNGDDYVEFSLDGSMGVAGTGFHRERPLRLRIESVAVKPGNTGTVTMTVTKTVSGTPRTRETDAIGAVSSAHVLEESASPASPAAAMTTGFRSFVRGDSVRPDRLAASVGRLSFGLASRDYYTFPVASTSTKPIRTLPGVIQDDPASSSTSTVTFAGDFSFASDAYLSTAPDCSSTGADRISASGAGFGSATSTPVSVNGKYLCIEVDGATPIPSTQPYRATVNYVTHGSPVLPPGNVELTLGRILSGGASVSIPFMSTNSSVNHRLFILNRLDDDVAYRIEFEPPAGTTAVKKGPATGTLPPGSTSLHIRDLVELQGRSRTALTLRVDAPPESLDVLTIRSNLSDGSTDTVRYEPEAR